MAEESSFTRWQGRSIEQLGNAINLLLSLTLATVGFTVSKLLDKEFQFVNGCSKVIFIIGSCGLLTTIILLLIVVYNRLLSFKKTTQIARKREKNDRNNIDSMRAHVKKLDRQSWNYLKASIVTFGIGEVFVIVGFLLEL